MNPLPDYIDRMADFLEQPDMGITQSPYHLVKAHGRPFQADENTFKGRKMRAHRCYMNASKLALDNPDLIYVEGYVQSVIPIEHAWVMRKDGTIIDPTLRNAGRSTPVEYYFGIPFSTDYLRKTIAETGYYGIISHTNAKGIKAIFDGFTGFKP